MKLSEADDAILTQLGETQKLLRELEKLDPAMATPANAHESAVVELSEIARDLNRYAENLDLDLEQLAALEERVSLFESLKRKYGATIADVIAFGERAAERMRKIEGRNEELQRLANELATHTAELRRTGDTLRKLRAKAAPKLSEMVRRNLRDLGFKQSQFEARLSEAQIPRPSGFDTVELLFSPNPGEPLKPMRAIASSGEISRLMLAIKSALAAQDKVPLLVFDEIDANVGGEIAHAVGGRMRELAKRHQVLCITHLPPVAAAATSQFVVTKEVRSGRTFTQLREVTGKGRREEIARMLGGKSEEAMKLAAPGTEAGINCGMVMGYWEQACALLNKGLLDEDLFFETSGEFFMVWELLKPVADQFRQAFKDPTMLKNLQTAAERFEAWKEQRAPGNIAAMREWMP